MTSHLNASLPPSEAPIGAEDPASPADHRTVKRMRGELWLVQRVLQVERERVAQLAEHWGHRDFALFLRDRAEREKMDLSE